MGEDGAGPHDSVSGLMDAAISAKSAFICSCLPDRAYDCGIANACDAITHAAIAADNLQQAEDNTEQRMRRTRIMVWKSVRSIT
jgi:hypothetical protein